MMATKAKPPASVAQQVFDTPFEFKFATQSVRLAFTDLTIGQNARAAKALRVRDMDGDMRALTLAKFWAVARDNGLNWDLDDMLALTADEYERCWQLPADLEQALEEVAAEAGDEEPDDPEG